MYTQYTAKMPHTHQHNCWQHTHPVSKLDL